MATKNVRVPEVLGQKAEEAHKRHIYRKIGQKMGGELLISGAEKKWKTESFIYVSLLRVVGTEQFLRKYLTDNEMSKTEIDAVLKQGFTADRIKAGNFKKNFETELAELEDFRKNRSRGQSKYDLDELMDLSLQLKDSEDKMPSEKAVVRKPKAAPKKTATKAAPVAKKTVIVKRVVPVKKVPVKKASEEVEEAEEADEAEEEAPVAKPSARASSAASAAVVKKPVVTKVVGSSAASKPLAKPVGGAKR